MGNPSDGKKKKPDKKCKFCEEILIDDEKNEGVCDDCHKKNPPCLSDPATANAKEKFKKAKAKQEETVSREAVEEEYENPELPLDSKQDLKEIAKGIHAGKIFTSNHLHKNESLNTLGMVFMPLLFMDKKAKDDLIKAKASVFWEWMDQAGPRAINGYPIFMSMRFMTDAEWIKVMAYVKKIEAFEKELEV